MVFSNTTTRLGLIQECEDLTGLGDANISGNAVMLDRFTRWINESYFKATGLIIQADGRWQWDDSNQTDQPIATADLVNGQRDYTVIIGSPSSTQDWLEIDRVEMQDQAGNKILLRPFDKQDLRSSIDQWYKTDSIPFRYDFEGGSLKLYPSPNYAKTDGLKIWFKRAPLLFADTDTTKKPGFSSLYHRILAYEASMSYLLTKDMSRVNNIKVLADEMLVQLTRHYSKRSKFEIPRVSRPMGILRK